MGDRRTASQLIEVLYDPTFDLDIFVSITDNIKDCDKLSSKSTKIV